MSEPTGSPGELERQIEQARTELARSVDAIVDRVHPKKVVKRSMDQFRERVGFGAARRADAAGGGRHASPESGGPPVRKEYLIAAAAVVAAGAVAVVVWRRSRS